MKQIEKLLIEEFKKNNINYDTKPMYDYVDDSFTDVLKSVIGVVEKLAIPAVVGQSEQLQSFVSGFYQWHREQNYVSVKRTDWDEYIKTL